VSKPLRLGKDNISGISLIMKPKRKERKRALLRLVTESGDFITVPSMNVLC
jgi:hypothetical protein